MNKAVKTSALFDVKDGFLLSLFSECEYPWEILPRIKSFINDFSSKGLNGYKKHADNVLIGENVRIADSAVIIGPAIIGHNTEIRTGAYLRGSVIVGEGCVIGNSTELKNCIVLDRAQIPHYNYVGDSIIGMKAHLGAGAICSNLKADGRYVVVHGEKDYETGLRKVGGFIGDGADVGCQCVINPGTVVGRRTSVYPLTSLRGVYPADCIVKSATAYLKRK